MSDDQHHDATAVSEWGGRRPRSSAERTAVTRRWLLRTSFAVGVSLLALTVLVLVLVGSDEEDVAIIGASRASWDPATDDALGEGKAASVEIIETDDEHLVYVYDIEVLRPPAEVEFIEVWLVEREAGDVVDRLSVGGIDLIRTRLFTLPEGTDVERFDAVEFSLETDGTDDGFSGRVLMSGEIAWLEAPPDE